MNLKPKTYHLKPDRGFTVIELLVSTGIIIVIMGLVFVGYTRFKARSSLAALAREVGLLVREAQVYGLAVKEFPVRDAEFPPYGVHISADKPKEIILFGDIVGALTGDEGDGIYQSGDGCGSANTECIRRITIAGPEFVERICVNPGGGQSQQEPVELCDITELNISFRRPDPEASIIVSDSAVKYNGAKIYLRSTKDTREERVVRVWITGQISIP